MYAVGEGGVDFDPAIDRARVHEEGAWFEPTRAFAAEAEHTSILSEAGKVGARLAFMLDA